jgi:hypothetical protein
VSGDAGAVEARLLGAVAEHPGDGPSAEGLVADPGLPGPGEQRSPGIVSELGAAESGPGGEGGDGVGAGVAAVRDGDLLAVLLLVGLGLPDRDEDAGRLVVDVSEGEGGELGAAHRGGVAEQDDRGVADPDRLGGVDGVDDPADLGGGERVGQAPWCGAVAAAQPEADLADKGGLGGVREAVLEVDVADRGADHVQAGHRGPVGGPLDQVGGQGGGVGGQRVDPPAGAPAGPDPPGVRVQDPGRLGVRGLEGGRDPDRVLDRQAGRQLSGQVGGSGSGGRRECHAGVVPTTTR